MSSPKPYVPSAGVEIHVTRSFVADFGELESQIGNESKGVYDQVLIALDALRDQLPQATLPITPHGVIGDSFQYRLNVDFAFTFKMVTDRDSERRPILFHYFLKNLFRLRS